MQHDNYVNLKKKLIVKPQHFLRGAAVIVLFMDEQKPFGNEN